MSIVKVTDDWEPSSNGTWYLFDGKLDELAIGIKMTSQEIANLFSGSADILLNGTVSAKQSN